MVSIDIFNEDCLDGMKRLPDGSIDFILTDLPFSITDAAWDNKIPLKPMWEQFKRVTKRNAAVALFASGKFLVELAASNLRDYRYKWIWRKSLPVNFLNAKRMPLRVHEDILIFYQQLPTYNPQFTQGKPYKPHGRNATANLYVPNGGKGFDDRKVESIDGKRYPLDVQQFPQPLGDKAHPTQKPVQLLEYLINTYTNEGETVVDPTMGSGSTGVACVNTNRHFVGFETEKNFYDIAQKRLEKAIAEQEQRLF